MPTASRWLVRAALLWLGIGFTLAGLMLANKGLPLSGWWWTWRLAHVQMLLIGWMVQFAAGIAYWILPRLGGGSRGREGLAWLTWVALNGGVLLAALRDPLVGVVDATVTAMLSAAAALLYLVAIATFLALVWPRVIPLPTFSEADLAALRRRTQEPPQ